MTIQIIENIRNKIANDEMQEALIIFRENCQEHATELIIHSNKYSSLSSSIRQGIISREQSILEKNILCKSLLDLLDEIDIKETAPKNNQHKMNPELRDILGLAELISRRKGKLRTSTRDFFTALATLKPDSLDSFLSELNQRKAIPKSADTQILSLPRKLSNNRILSACLTESLSELNQIAEPEINEITPADMFIDVSKFGKGKSVAKLRKKGIGKSEIDEYVNQFDIEVKRRIENEN